MVLKVFFYHTTYHSTSFLALRYFKQVLKHVTVIHMTFIGLNLGFQKEMKTRFYILAYREAWCFLKSRVNEYCDEAFRLHSHNQVEVI